MPLASDRQVNEKPFEIGMNSQKSAGFDPLSWDKTVFVFRGRRADRLTILWWDGTGLCLYAKRMERGRFVWPLTREGTVRLTGAQSSMLSEGAEECPHI